MYTAIFIYLGKHTPDSKGYYVWYKPACFEKKIDNEVLAYQQSCSGVGSSGCGEMHKRRIVAPICGLANQHYQPSDIEQQHAR